MKPGGVLLVSRDQLLAQQVRRAVRLSSASVAVFTSFEHLDQSLDDVDFAFLDGRLIDELDPLALPTGVRGKELAIIAAGRPSPRALELFQLPRCNHILGTFDESELLCTLYKHRTQDLFGLTKYLLKACIHYDLEIRSYADKALALEWVASTGRRVGATRRLRTAIELAADELLTAAMYPSNPDGAIDETQVLPVRFQWTCVGGSFHISVTDSVGAFPKAKLVSAFSATGEVPIGGLSLQSLLYNKCRRIVANVAPGSSAELIVSLPLGQDRVWTSPSSVSIGYFQQGSTGPTQSGFERRRNDRIPLDLAGSVVHQVLPGRRNGTVVDISVGGALLAIDGTDAQSWEVGSVAMLILPIAMAKHLEVQFCVIRVHSRSPLELGVAFLEMHPGDMALLLNLVEGELES